MKIDNMREEHRERLNLTQAEEAQAEESKPEEPRKRLWICGSIDRPGNE